MLFVYIPKLSFSQLHLLHPVTRTNEKKGLPTHLVDPRKEIGISVPEI
jgi:hypothetical protein